MKLKNVLHVAVALLFFSGSLVNQFGYDRGVADEHIQTTEGLLTGLGLGALAWLGFLMWRGERKEE